MKIKCVLEHNGNDSLLYSSNLIGAFTRGKSKEEALSKMEAEAKSYLLWKGNKINEAFEIEICQEKESDLDICDGDSDVIFESEKQALSLEEYEKLKRLALKSAEDFLALYNAVPDKKKTSLPERKTFYGKVPRTADEMYMHTKNVNSYYFSEIGVEADNDGDILKCRKRGFEALEKADNFLEGKVCIGSYDEEWSVRKVIRRFIWHDRIHAKAMYRMAVKAFASGSVPDLFRFEK